MTDLFTFEEVSVRVGATQILDRLTLSVPDSGITAVTGASGSGKSTMLRCCNLLELPTGGRIDFRGTDLAHADPRTHRRKVAMVFQTPTVFPGTAAENLRAADRDLDDDGRRALMERVGLPVDLLERDADALSGGEAQRLCLARALATDPEVILADECTSALDQTSGRVLEQLARTLSTSGVPVIWVTHDHRQVDRIADHVIELAHGRLMRSGPAADRPSRETSR